MGRKPLSSEQRATREPIIDTHIQLPVSLVAQIDAHRNDESRRAFIVRALSEYLAGLDEKQNLPSKPLDVYLDIH